MLSAKYYELQQRLKNEIPADRLIHDDLRLLAFGTDASFYRLLPKMVIKVHNETEVIKVIQECHRLNIALTIRAAGTSLSGQSISDSVLMLLVPSQWRSYSINENQDEITAQPAMMGEKMNQALLALGKKIGPDPASIKHASIGGIVVNNAAGMASGIRWNSYNTLTGLRLVLHDGSILDTRDRESRAVFAESHKDMLEQLDKLAKGVRRKKKMAGRIKEKFSIKNTTGYSVNALIDFKDPIDILMHLMVGSEGTLGFISEISIQAIDNPPKRATSLVLFPDIAAACNSIPILHTCKVATAELMDRAALKSVENDPAMPDYLKELDTKVTALLVETRANDDKTLQKQVSEIKKKLKKVELVHPLEFSSDDIEIDGLWRVRQGLFPSVSASREKGTTVIIEDIAVPQQFLAKALVELQQLFEKYHYVDSIIWGHALDGNVHFILTQNFNTDAETSRYDKFMNEVVSMVLDKYNGSLKAEHGTGRNMAPFVEREWGPEIYQVMIQVKQILDPNGLFNPGVLLNNDPQLHLKHLKPMPMAHDLVDACIECGFCENNCVSRELTLSPRQRIAVYREMQHLVHVGHEPHRLAQLRNDYDYYGNQTCATDGLCALSCPVDIDTGKLIKVLRQEGASARAKQIAGWIADHMDRITAVMRFGLGILSLKQQFFGNKAMQGVFDFMRRFSGNRLPHWSPHMPGAAKTLFPQKVNADNPLKVVYFSTCINRTMGVSAEQGAEVPLVDKTIQLLKKAGYEIIVPDNVNNLCCGMAFSSKGLVDAAQRKQSELEATLLQATNSGEYPVLVDMSPCLYHMKETLDVRLNLYEPIEFTLKFLKEHLQFTPTNEPIAIFSVCSAKKMELEDAFLELAEMCSTNVTVNEANCCGFAGDRGFSYPELNADGLKDLKSQIPTDVKHGFSTSRTCEIGLSEHSGIGYKSILYLVDQCTEAKK